MSEDLIFKFPLSSCSDILNMMSQTEYISVSNFQIQQVPASFTVLLLESYCQNKTSKMDFKTYIIYIKF
jgi:hypothetical protein